jgi:RNA polymerase sigma factor (sigma-70 family)
MEEHRDAVWRFLAASVGPAEADDCFQETFLAALRAYPRVRIPDDGSLRGWILTIAHRKALDAHRARGRRPASTDQVDVVAVDGRPATSAGGGVWAAVRALPPKQRAAVALRFVADLPHGDIAGVLDISEDAARRNVHDGLARLRKEWT